MYHCKVARTEIEMKAIARLNYETFVEEIPQHPPNAERLLIDKFHHENTYIVLYKDQTLIGMLAFRDVRPFSIDQKIGDVERYLPEKVCEKMCEVRLLAIKKEYRVGRVFLRLAQALYAYVLGKNYSACVISGVTSQEHLYKRIGFTQFAEAVGTDEARFLPMVLKSEDGHNFYAQFQKKHAIFFPGPVQQQQELKYTTVSHRSEMSERMLTQLRRELLQLSRAKAVSLLLGSGTAANDMMLTQLKAQVNNEKGLICVNGEFGQRLVTQARALNLQFDVYEEQWGQSFSQDTLEQKVQASKWCLFVHGETSTGMLNDLLIFVQLKEKYKFTLAVDCISSFGAVDFSLEHVDLATGTSGKAIGALAGLSFVFYHDRLLSGGATYFDMTNYQNTIPFTLPAYLVGNMLEHLSQYPNRFDELERRLQTVLKFDQFHLIKTSNFPTAVSFVVPKHFVLDAQLNGIELHASSTYLEKRNLAQISTIQPAFYKDYEVFMDWYKMYQFVL